MRGYLWTFMFASSGSYPSGQDRIVVSTSGSELYDLDINDCSANLIGQSSVTFTDIAFTPVGRLWGVRSNRLYGIDPSNASDVLVGYMPSCYPVSLVAFNNDILLGEYRACLWGIRTSDGYAWRIDTIGHYATGDLTWYQGALFMTATGTPRKLVRFEVDEALTTVSNVTVVGPLPMGSWYGANTILVDHCSHELMMLGFDSRNVYRLAPGDASVTLLCEEVLPTVSTGAASLGELIERTRPSDLEGVNNVFSPNADGINDVFTPIRGIANADWYLEVYNRWGEKVFEGHTVPWNGRTAAGERCPDGVYYFRVTVRTECDPPWVEHGHLTLVR